MSGKEPEDDDYLAATQIGAVAQNIVASRIILPPHGRLSPFLHVADDGGVDLLIFSKESRRAIPVQVKCCVASTRALCVTFSRG